MNLFLNALPLAQYVLFVCCRVFSRFCTLSRYLATNECTDYRLLILRDAEICMYLVSLIFTLNPIPAYFNLAPCKPLARPIDSSWRCYHNTVSTCLACFRIAFIRIFIRRFDNVASVVSPQTARRMGCTTPHIVSFRFDRVARWGKSEPLHSTNKQITTPLSTWRSIDTRFVCYKKRHNCITYKGKIVRNLCFNVTSLRDKYRDKYNSHVYIYVN